MAFIENMDVRKIPGIGPQSEDVLKGLNINTVRDIRSRLFDLFIIFGDYQCFLSYACKSFGIREVFCLLTLALPFSVKRQEVV